MTFLAVLVVCACFYGCVRELAGKVTWADLRFRVLANLSANRWAALIVSWSLTGGATTWALGERRLRKAHIRRVSSESSEMQKILDPKRRSSGLNLRGDTSPGDE
jgi:hypothetical protein